MVMRNGFLSTRFAALWLLSFGALAGSASCTNGTEDDGTGGNAGEASSSGGKSSTGGKSGSGGAKPASGGTSQGSGGKPQNSGGSAGDPGSGGAGPTSGGASSGGASNPTYYVSTPEDLTDESEVDYADNEHGIITGGRLKRWIDDWENKRPAAIEGRLIILQVVPDSVTSSVNIASNEKKGVYTYLVGAKTFNQNGRSNGYTSFESDIPDGPNADAFFKRFAIDPRKDLIVLSFEQFSNTQNSIVHSIGRAWLFLKYWGVDSEHIAILNGSLNWNAGTYGFPLTPLASHTFSDAPYDGTFSVRDLHVDNTAIAIPLEEIVSILEERRDAPTVDDGIRIVDARGGAEAYGLAKATSTGQTSCTNYAAGNKCSTPFEGRLKGAKSVPWGQFLDTAPNGFRFLPKIQIRAIFDAQSGWNSSTSELTIQYCRTNQRSTVTGIVANTILGYPTRLYESSFIEWGYSSAGPDPDGLGGAGNIGEAPNKHVVAADFPFRTDLDYLTEHAVLHPDDVGAYVPGGTLGALTQPVTWVDGPNYNAEADVAPQVPGTWPKLDPEATTTRLTIDQDRAYLRDVTIDELD